MTSAWDKAREAAERQAEKGSIFVRLKNNGDKVIGAFCGDPYFRDVLWTGQKYEEHDPNNPEHKGAKTSFRVSLNFFVPADNAMKVIEGSSTFFQTILKVKDKYGLEGNLFEIEREGEANSTKTKYHVLPDRPLPDAVRRQIASAKLHNLADVGKGEEDQDGGEPADKPGTPVSEQQAVAIVERLKTLPKSDVTAFLGKFGIARVRDLKQSDARAAKELLDELTGTGAEVDPFA